MTEAADEAVVLREQLSDLTRHFAICARWGFPDCDQYRNVRTLLLRPFINPIRPAKRTTKGAISRLIEKLT